MYEDKDNDGKFPDESPVEIRYPSSKQEEQREQWPWLPGTIVEQCGPGERYVCVEGRELAVLRDGRRAPRGAASRNLYYPCCFRDGSEIRPRTASSGATSATRRGAARFMPWLSTGATLPRHSRNGSCRAVCDQADRPPAIQSLLLACVSWGRRYWCYKRKPSRAEFTDCMNHPLVLSL
jgi:hypothetical protein